MPPARHVRRLGPFPALAYNWGEGNVGRAGQPRPRAGLEPTYENLRYAERNTQLRSQTFGRP